MAKSREDGVTDVAKNDHHTALDAHQKRLSAMLATETDSTKRNAIVNQRSAIKQAMALLADVTL